MRRLLALLVCVVPLALAAACTDDGGSDVSQPADGQRVSEGTPLHDARLDLAKRLDVEPLEIELLSVRSAGFDGCLGVTTPGQACTEQFIGGYIAIYEAGGAQHRYHFGGDRFVYADPSKQVSDGTPVTAEIAPDLNRELASYAREDLDLRVDGEAIVTAILPGQFPNGCMGFVPVGMGACTDVIVDGAVVFLAGGDGETYRYHVGDAGAIATDFEDGETTFEPNAAVRVQQQLLRQDLARRLQAPVEEIGVVSYRLVTWSDGCLGVYRPSVVCAQALVSGSLALLSGPDGKEYRYHGGGHGGFVAASFEVGARIAEPMALPP